MLYIGQIVKKVKKEGDNSENEYFAYVGGGKHTVLYDIEGRRLETSNDFYTTAHGDNTNHCVSVPMENDSMWFGEGTPKAGFLDRIKEAIALQKSLEECVDYTCSKCSRRARWMRNYFKESVKNAISDVNEIWKGKKDADDYMHSMKNVREMQYHREYREYGCWGNWGSSKENPLTLFLRSKILEFWGERFSAEDQAKNLEAINILLAN